MEDFQDDKVLVEAIKRDKASMNQAIRWLLKNEKWRSAVRILIRKYHLKETIKNEVFHEALTVLIMNIRTDKFRGGSLVKTYFEGICKNILKMRLTKKYRDAQRFVLMENEQIIKIETVDQKEIEEAERQSAIQLMLKELINQLGDKCKKVLGYIALGFSMKEIAFNMKQESQSIKNRALKCRKQLRKLGLENPSLMNEINSLI